MSAVSVARYALDKYWDRALPVDIENIAHQMGVSINKTTGIDGDWDISGKFSYEEGVPTCWVSITDTEQRQRFTLAHELGHFALNHGEQVDSTESLYRKTQGWQHSREREANAFAAEILMPKIAIDFLIEKKGITGIRALAQALNVSPVAMEYRLKNVGWLY